MPNYTLKSLIEIHNGSDYRHLEKGKIPVFGSGGYMTSVDQYQHDGEAILLPRKGTLDNIMYINGKFWTVDTMYWATVNSDLADPYYLYCLLKILDFSGVYTGSTLPSMTSSAYYGIKVILPDLTIQKRISDLIFSIDSKIALNNKINSELEKLAKTLYDYWFVQFDFPDEFGRPYKSSGGKMVYNEVLKREIPEGWNVLNLGERLNFEKGIEPGTDNYIENPTNLDQHVKFYRVGDMDDSGTTYLLKNKYKDAPILNPYDLVVSLDGSVGRLSFGLNGMYSSGIRRISDRLGLLDSSTLYFIFQNSYIQATIQKYASGSNILHAGASVAHLAIAYNEKVFLQYQGIIKSIYNQMVQNKLENSNLVNLRDFLLPMLMNGQVTINS